jgi:hypothetical protein
MSIYKTITRKHVKTKVKGKAVIQSFSMVTLRMNVALLLMGAGGYRKHFFFF